MKLNTLKKQLLCLMLAFALTLTAVGCGQKAETAEAPAAEQSLPGGVLGEGASVFAFTVVDSEGEETVFEIHTDEETVGAALLNLGLIAGEEGAYGLYVKVVNGITADYDVDQTYWAFYVNGEYATSGVDTTAIEAGASYSFKVEK